RPLQEAGIEDVWIGGPDMAALRDALEGAARVEYRPSVDEMLPFALKAVRPGDVVIVKSSKGTGFSRIVDALIAAFPPAEADSSGI
ncbi:UDP-N-acetylmuramoylalanyl-D-glutamyl-2, 6-diaminopimelate--D-alanyl-D-alanine ligase, partial [Rhizobium sp. TRM95111]|nr:UDP-N-acetylmuramoylalanyl-D-glutamyl-2, 6-diaminopimelate--D-alanyl-D-alanine ligase [Rhizobium alarense]